ncbi:nucleotide-diphospho-sugar transferase [Jimgerdemannia flammicorona]|uniref:Translation initiation factor eIF2B subunit gamma n=1 Tax=Jimgerdemannia flammicorona TaxID=994334 RepID=A0A433QPE8_9FUNG|nr:nucleotide-diphospho-sugar transferase [Jimgerdemannia flammicorona]
MFEKPQKPSEKIVEKISEFQAVILAGYGSSNRLYPLVDEDTAPKALLPVANKPLISYTLEWLDRSGVTGIVQIKRHHAATYPSGQGHPLTRQLSPSQPDVIILTQTHNNAFQKLSAHVRNYSGPLHLRLVTLDEDVGTADALRIIKDKIDRDFIVLSCDLITDLMPNDLLDYHRLQDPTVTALFYEPSKSEGGGTTKEAEKTQFVGIDAAKSRLLYVSGGRRARGKAEKDREMEEEFTLRMSLLWRFPRVTLHTKLRDAHLYIFKRWVIDLIAAKENLSSVRTDLIPLLVKCQFQRKLVEREEIARSESSIPVCLAQSCPPSSMSLDPSVLALSTTADLGEDEVALTPMDTFVAPVKALAYIFRGGFCERGNTVPSYCELNRCVSFGVGCRAAASACVGRLFVPNPVPLTFISYVCTMCLILLFFILHAQLTKQSALRVALTADVSGRAQVGADSMVGEFTRIDERTSVKRSTIGAHCVIGKNVKISNSVVLDHVVIEDKCVRGSGDWVERKKIFMMFESIVRFVKMDGCVVCNHAKIEEKAQLKDCEVGGGYVVGRESDCEQKRADGRVPGHGHRRKLLEGIGEGGLVLYLLKGVLVSDQQYQSLSVSMMFNKFIDSRCHSAFKTGYSPWNPKDVI